MKISSVSKKVLASALSAAMVVAFAPTAAFAAIADFDGSGKATGITDEKAIAAGYTFKSVAESGSLLVTTYYKASEIDGSSVTTDLTMIADTDAKIVLAAGQDLDLNGHTLSYTKAKAATDYALTVVKANDESTPSVIKNGTIESVDFTADGAKAPTVVPGLNANYHVQLNNVTVDSIDGSATITAKGTVAVAGDFDVYTLKLDKSAKVTSGAIAIAAGGAGVQMGEASSLEATASNKKGTATAIDGAVTMAKNATVVATAETTGSVDYDNNGTPATRDVTATAITGAVDMGAGEGASLTAIAKTTGIDTVDGDTTDADAIALAGTDAITVGKNQTLKAIASAADDYAKVTAVSSNLTTEAGSTVEIAATASTETVVKPASAANVKDFAIAADKTLTAKVGTKAATVKGYFAGAGTDKIEAGSYSMDPKPYVDATKFDITDSNGLFTVEQAEGFKLNNTITGGEEFATNAEGALIKTAVENALDGKIGAATLSYAEGYDLAKVRALANGTKLKLALKDAVTTEKKATDAQKAALEAVNAYAVKNSSSKVTWETLSFASAYLFFNDTENDNAVVKVADVTNFGATVGSRKSTDNTVSIDHKTAADYAKFVADGKVWVSVDAAGNVTPMQYTKNADGTYDVFVTSAPFAYAQLSVDMSAIKDDVNKGEETAEKATQGIDVSKKSMTVKLGAKKTKLAKSKTFSMGASAETELTSSKKSGSKYITVSGQKVTLKKGVKRGTYTAKVSLKAAASDAYLAAAKTITVKFVIK